MEGEGISRSQEREKALPGGGGRRWRGDWLYLTPEEQPCLRPTVLGPSL